MSHALVSQQRFRCAQAIRVEQRLRFDFELLQHFDRGNTVGAERVFEFCSTANAGFFTHAGFLQLA